MSDLPTSADLKALMTTARRIMVDVEHILQQSWERPTATRKVDGSLVTQMDHAVDAFITGELTKAFPDHAVLSEERNTHYDPSARYTWVVDPLDGTTNFARGLPIWGVSLGLFERGVPILGMLSFPSLHEKYEASHQQGAFFNGRRLSTEADATVSDQHFLMLCTRTPRRYTINTPLKPRMLGSAAYHIATVASGSALAAIESTPKLWDLAAALLILTEAGGCYQRIEGQQPIFPLAPTAQNYEHISFPLLAAVNKSILDKLLTGVTPRS